MTELRRHIKPSANHGHTAKGAVLCIEDDPVVQIMLGDIVGGAGGNCFIVGTAREAEERLAEEQFDLVLLDRRLPDSDGLLLMKRVQESSGCPVIILSAMDDPRDKILGIGLGASEYVTKPFSPLELSSRIRQLLAANLQEGEETCPEFFEIGEMVFSPSIRKLAYKGEETYLAPAESRLLCALLLHEGDVQSRTDLTKYVCNRDWSPGDRTVDVLINRLRRSLPSDVAEIVTLHRAGYILVRKRED